LDLEREISDKMKGHADLLEPQSLSAFFKEVLTAARKERTYERHCWFNAPRLIMPYGGGVCVEQHHG
jgi:hypothetical protein